MDRIFTKTNLPGKGDFTNWRETNPKKTVPNQECNIWGKFNYKAANQRMQYCGRIPVNKNEVNIVLSRILTQQFNPSTKDENESKINYEVKNENTTGETLNQQNSGKQIENEKDTAENDDLTQGRNEELAKPNNENVDPPPKKVYPPRVKRKRPGGKMMRRRRNFRRNIERKIRYLRNWYTKKMVHGDKDFGYSIYDRRQRFDDDDDEERDYYSDRSNYGDERSNDENHSVHSDYDIAGDDYNSNHGSSNYSHRNFEEQDDCRRYRNFDVDSRNYFNRNDSNRRSDYHEEMVTRESNFFEDGSSSHSNRHPNNFEDPNINQNQISNYGSVQERGSGVYNNSFPLNHRQYTNDSSFVNFRLPRNCKDSRNNLEQYPKKRNSISTSDSQNPMPSTSSNSYFGNEIYVDENIPINPSSSRFSQNFDNPDNDWNQFSVNERCSSRFNPTNTEFNNSSRFSQNVANCNRSSNSRNQISHQKPDPLASQPVGGFSQMSSHYHNRSYVSQKHPYTDPDINRDQVPTNLNSGQQQCSSQFGRTNSYDKIERINSTMDNFNQPDPSERNWCRNADGLNNQFPRTFVERENNFNRFPVNRNSEYRLKTDSVVSQSKNKLKQMSSSDKTERNNPTDDDFNQTEHIAEERSKRTYTDRFRYRVSGSLSEIDLIAANQTNSSQSKFIKSELSNRNRYTHTDSYGSNLLPENCVDPVNNLRGSPNEVNSMNSDFQQKTDPFAYNSRFISNENTEIDRNYTNSNQRLVDLKGFSQSDKIITSNKNQGLLPEPHKLPEYRFEERYQYKPQYRKKPYYRQNLNSKNQGHPNEVQDYSRFSKWWNKYPDPKNDNL